MTYEDDQDEPDASSNGSASVDSSCSSLTTCGSSGDRQESRRRRVEFSEAVSCEASDVLSALPGSSAALGYRRPVSSASSSSVLRYGGGGGVSERPTYRLASLDRLAQRHKLYSSSDTNSTALSSSCTTIERQNQSSSTTCSGSGAVGAVDNGHDQPVSRRVTVTSGSAAISCTSTPISSLQNKREIFFRGEPSSSSSSSTSSSSQVNGGSSHNSSVTSSNSAGVAVKEAAMIPSSSTPASATAVAAAGLVSPLPHTAASHPSGRDNKENRPEASQRHDASSSNRGVAAAASSSQSSHRAPAPPASEPGVPSHHRPHNNDASATSSSSSCSQTASASTTTAVASAKALIRSARQPDGYVGFANLPNQVFRRAVKRGFHFTLMVVGESGLGKSTLINSMFMTDIYNNEHPGPSQRIKKTVSVEKTVVALKENGVNLTLTVVDTPGFGDAVDNSNCWQPVVDYIETQYEDYLNAESRVVRCEVADTRVHCCIYFITPSGHTLKPLDVEFMKRLHDKVNIVPVIAKADTMTPEEVTRFKKQVMKEITQHKIRIYEFPDCGDEGENRAQKLLRDRVPFSVIGANTVVEVDGKKVRGRRYPWGVVQVENMEHSDFLPLRNMLIRTHMMDLCAVTNNVHYENYRCRALAGVGSEANTNKLANKNPLAQIEEEKRDHESKMKKMQAEMEQVFEMKVREKRNKLKESEEDLEKREKQMIGPLDEQRKQLQLRRAAFGQERADWEHTHGTSVAALRRKELETNSKEALTKQNSFMSSGKHTNIQTLRRHFAKF